MKTLQILGKLSKLGFKIGLFTANGNHFSLTSKLQDDKTLLNIMICNHEDFPRYMVTLQVNDKNVIDELYCPEDKFDNIINSIENHINISENAKEINHAADNTESTSSQSIDC